jgi:PAS domain S-box-containing protein
MRMLNKEWLLVLLAVLVTEPVLTLLTRFDDLERLVAGDHRLPTTLAMAGLGWLALVVVAAIVLGRSLLAARTALYRQGQAIEADAATSRDWLWETDTAHRLTYSSAGVVDVLGYAPEELIGRSTLSLLTPDQVVDAERLLARCRTTKQGWNAVELSWQHKQEHAVALQGTAAPMLDPRGRLVGFRGTSRRVTEAMAAERLLAGAKQRVTDLLSTAALDIGLQPVVDLGTGRMAGAEALARFRDGRGPDEWFQDARDSGLGLDLDRLAFRAALPLLATLPDGCYLSVNASPELLTDGRCLRELAAGGVALDRLVIEITEHVKITSYRDLHAALAPLREHGLRLAIDDTGAGYASLHHVLQLRPDIIKIDRSLIADVNSDAARRSLVTAFVLLALELDATVTAEGVETPTELEMLAVLGVDCAQGFLLATPTIDRERWRVWFTRNWLQPTARRQSPRGTRELVLDEPSAAASRISV